MLKTMRVISNSFGCIVKRLERPEKGAKRATFNREDAEDDTGGSK